MRQGKHTITEFVLCYVSFAVVNSDGSEVAIAKQQQRSVTSVRLPAGSAGNEYVTTVRAVIVDIFGARATTDFAVTVQFPPYNFCILR